MKNRRDVINVNIVYPREYIVPINLINIKNFDFTIPELNSSSFRLKEFSIEDDRNNNDDNCNKTIGEIFEEIDKEYIDEIEK